MRQAFGPAQWGLFFAFLFSTVFACSDSFKERRYTRTPFAAGEGQVYVATQQSLSLTSSVVFSGTLTCSGGNPDASFSSDGNTTIPVTQPCRSPRITNGKVSFEGAEYAVGSDFNGSGGFEGSGYRIHIRNASIPDPFEPGSVASMEVELELGGDSSISSNPPSFSGSGAANGISTTVTGSSIAEGATCSASWAADGEESDLGTMTIAIDSCTKVNGDPCSFDSVDSNYNADSCSLSGLTAECTNVYFSEMTSSNHVVFTNAADSDDITSLTCEVVGVYDSSPAPAP